MLKSHTETMPKSLSDVLLYEVGQEWSRQGGEFAATETTVPMGAVVCLNDEGRYVPFGTELEPAQEAVEASEGVEAKEAVPAKIADKAIGVLISREMEISAEVQPCVVIRRGAVVANLFWLEGVSDEQKKTALGDLEALGIITRE